MVADVGEERVGDDEECCGDGEVGDEVGEGGGEVSDTTLRTRRRGTCGAGGEQMKGRRGDTMHAQDRGGGLGVEGVVCACVCGVGVAVPRAWWR